MLPGCSDNAVKLYILSLCGEWKEYCPVLAVKVSVTSPLRKRRCELRYPVRKSRSICFLHNREKTDSQRKIQFGASADDHPCASISTGKRALRASRLYPRDVLW